MTTDMDQRLDAALKARSQLEALQQRIVGKLEVARKDLAAVEQECRDKGREPKDLDDTIAQLEARYGEMVEQLERGVSDARSALAPYLAEENTR